MARWPDLSLCLRVSVPPWWVFFCGGKNRSGIGKPHWVFCRQSIEMTQEIALSSILGAPVYDASGAVAGRVREVALSPQDDPSRISDFVVKTPGGDCLLPARAVSALERSAVRATALRTTWKAADFPPLVSSQGMLLLERD